ncbi:MAG: sel1 repeat family protein [Paludibacteraceae bacterium]|nr:sel1 repeat family protein [Paludibacteraceae bacterium]
MAAENGFPRAQCILGVCYVNGDGFVEKDYNKAFYCFKKSAEQGYVNAQYELGICYKNGYGVEKDYNEAVKWYRKAAENGNYDAMVILSKAVDNELPISEEEAQKWAKKSEVQKMKDMKE